MSGLKSEVDALIALAQESGTMRQAVIPINVGAGTITAVPAVCPLYGIWSAVGLAADIALRTLVVGVCIDTIGAIETYTIQIGNGRGFANVGLLNAGGAPAVLAAARVTFRLEATTIIEGKLWPIMFPVPVLYNVGEFICARVGNLAAAAGGTMNITALAVTGF